MRIIVLFLLAFPAFAHQYTALDDLVVDVCSQHTFEKCSDPVIDTDNDGIPDDIDECPTDPTNTCNDPIDTDGDGVNDNVDQCPSTPPGATVDSVGCEVVVVPPDASCEPIVYSWVPRTTGTHTVKTKLGDVSVSNVDAHDKLPEVSRQLDKFNVPGQLVVRQCDGTETVIYDCFEQDRPCAAFDAMPSLDGTKIAFAVYSADSTVKAFYNGVTYPNEHLGTKNFESRIYIHDLASGANKGWPHVKGQHDTSPVWLPDGRLMFTSTRNGQWRPWLNKISPKANRDPRLFIANEDGSGVVDVSPHAHGGVMHPYVLDSGRVAIGTQWQSHNLGYIGTNGGINWPGTLDNMWALEDVDYRGGDSTTLLGGHKNSIKDGSGRTKTQKAFHFVGQRQNATKDVLVGNYYRANNLGLGDIWGFPPQAKGVEGPTPSFIPTGAYNVANWSKSNDEQAKKGQGKIGWPEGTADGQIMMTLGQGICTRIGTTVAVLNGLDQIGCNTGIYKTTVIPSKSIDDLVKVVDRPDRHEFNARVIRKRTVAIPELSITGDGSCELVSTDAGSTDAHNYKPYTFNNNYRAMANNGGEIQGLDHSELAAIRFYKVLPNLSKKTIDRTRNHIGNKVERLGPDVPLLDDKSFAVKLPCDTSYLMAGVDKDGLIIKRDQLAQSLRPNEKRVCSGCHLHGEEGRKYPDSLAFSTNAVERYTTTPVPTFENDIKPIFQSKCGSCHNQDSFLFEHEKLVWDYFQLYTYEGKRLQVRTSGSDKRQYGLHRPYTSKYVNNMFARESLLYWKAANKRTDGRTDDTYNNDIDFGADHPTDLNPPELDLIARWLDSGAAQ